jgi:hypothetical protein
VSREPRDRRLIHLPTVCTVRGADSSRLVLTSVNNRICDATNDLLVDIAVEEVLKEKKVEGVSREGKPRAAIPTRARVVASHTQEFQPIGGVLARPLSRAAADPARARAARARATMV